MAELTARGADPGDLWCRRLPDDHSVVLGKDEGGWAVSWDPWISRRHAELLWQEGRLKVRQLPEARNAIFFRGKECASFDLGIGEAFVIGKTVFSLGQDQSPASPEGRTLLHVRMLGAKELQQVPYRNAPQQIDVLSHLPEVISRSSNVNELSAHLVNMLLAGISRATVVAMVTLADAEEHAQARILHWDHRPASPAEFQPSQRLIREAIHSQHKTVLHVWATTGASAASEPRYTLQGDFDWAFCTPVQGDACQGWGIYVAGRFSGDVGATLLAPWSDNELADDLKFVELVAGILSSLRQVQALQHRQAILGHFFSPAVMGVLSEGDPETTMKPRQTEVTVLFCDLRGYSRKVEATPNLFGLLERVSRALGVMTQNIIDHKGVIADFQGDAAMAFWGWPLVQPDHIQQACLAALGIRNLFARLTGHEDHPLADFQVGIGIATGMAVAGQIGAAEQFKVSVFGPVVNLAARLQGMTKILRVPILLDETTAELARQQLVPGVARCRRMARVKPYGLETPLTVTELLPSQAEHPLLSDEHVFRYEEALRAFLASDWSKAYDLLHQIPPQDHGKDVLLEFIIQHNHQPPGEWDGVIPLSSKD